MKIEASVALERSQMCGIAGFLDGRRSASEEAFVIARDMADGVARMMPASGPTAGPASHWPAVAWPSSPPRLQVVSRWSPSPGATSSVFNGEIYNHADIGRQREIRCRNACSWRRRSDTETFLAAIES